MTPRTADDRVRVALIDTAARLLAQEGPAALSTRRLASEVGVSTMALYTHFDGMDDLRRAVRIEWFSRLAEQLSRVPATADPVADLAAVGWAYFFNAIENEHMFRATVVDPLDGHSGAAFFSQEFVARDPVVATLGFEAFAVLVNSVQRCIDERHLHAGDAAARALQIWMMGNGVILACLAGFVAVEEAVSHFYDMAWSLLTSFGADPEAARASFERGRRRMDRRTKIAVTSRDGSSLARARRR